MNGPQQRTWYARASTPPPPACRATPAGSPSRGWWTWAGHSFDLHVETTYTGQHHAILTLHGLPEESVGADADSLGGDGHGLISRLENRLTGLDRSLATRAARLGVLEGEIDNHHLIEEAAEAFHSCGSSDR